MAETDQMGAAIRRQVAHAQVSSSVNRSGWTRQQWVDDARALMGHVDGAITSLVNGHVVALLDEVARLTAEVERLSPPAEWYAGEDAHGETWAWVDDARGRPQQVRESAFFAWLERVIPRRQPT